jgi:alpha-amylase
MTAPESASNRPLTIYHAFDLQFRDIESLVEGLAKQGYSHIQIPPAQKSNDAGGAWYGRYQPIDYTLIEGRGTEAELQSLTTRAHSHGLQVIADVVFNQMANSAPYYDKDTGKLDFPGLSPDDFHPRKDIDYRDENQIRNGWLNGDLPDLDQSRPTVQRLQKGHLSKLLALGVDGFRFDAAKHMSLETLRDYIEFINVESQQKAWNYLEVIEGDSIRAESYLHIAAVTDFRLYYAARDAFSFGGNLQNLCMVHALDDSRSVVFAMNHDTDQENATGPIECAYADRSDSLLATAFVLARERGVPLVLHTDNEVDCIRTGVKFRQLIHERANQGLSVTENVLHVIRENTILIMERGTEGLFIVNKAAEAFDISKLDVTFSHLGGHYRELHYDFTMDIESKNGQKVIVNWGSTNRDGLYIKGRDALYFVRDFSTLS